MKVLSFDWCQPCSFSAIPQFHSINEQWQMAMWVVFLILKYCNLIKTAIGQGLNLKFIFRFLLSNLTNSHLYIDTTQIVGIYGKPSMCWTIGQKIQPCYRLSSIVKGFLLGLLSIPDSDLGHTLFHLDPESPQSWCSYCLSYQFLLPVKHYILK